MRHSKYLILLASVFLISPGHSRAADFSAAEAKAEGHAKSAIETSSAAISTRDLRQYVSRLASTEYEGRGTADRGGRMATAYLATFFRELELSPAGDAGNYYQHFSFDAGKKLSGKNILEIKNTEPSGLIRKLQPGTDYQPLSFSPAAKIKPAPAVFCGFGIKTDGYDSFEGIEVTGRWAIMFRGSPKGQNKLQRFGPLVDKARTAKKLGAVGIMFIKGPNPAIGLEVVPPSKDVGTRGEIMPAICISDQLASVLLTGSEDGADFEKLFSKYHTMKSTKGFTLPGRISAEIGLEKASDQGRNVIGRLQVGTKPSTEKIVIGAHIDHLGYGKRGASRAGGDRSEQLHPGADDNASGVAAIMEIAQFFANRKRSGKLKLKRDLVFAGWSGEEIGLYGSKHYVKKAKEMGDGKIYPATAAYLNLDMIGRLGDNPLNVMATGSSKDWQAVLESLGENLNTKISPDPYLPTDSTSFYSAGVPVIALFTGLHDEYHTPDDTADKIDFDGLTGISHYLKSLTSAVADLDSPPAYLGIPRGGAQQRTKLVIGVRLENVPRNRGVKVLEVLPGSPAQKSGIRKGDVIELIGGKKTNDVNGLRDVLNKLEAGKKYSAGIKRGNKLLVFEIAPKKNQ